MEKDSTSNVSEFEKQEWLRAEFQFAWTTQSDINSRINAVYTAAMAISVAILGAVAVWGFNPETKADEIPFVVRVIMFSLPNIITIPFFMHNIEQRRAIVQIAGYWKALIEGSSGVKTWAARMDAYRMHRDSDLRFKSLTSEANDPVALSYVAVFSFSALLGFSSGFCGDLCKNVYFILMLVFVDVSIGVFLFSLVARWKKVVPTDAILMSEIWRRVALSEALSSDGDRL